MTPPFLVFPAEQGAPQGLFQVFEGPERVFSGPYLQEAEEWALSTGGFLAGGLRYGRAEESASGWWGVFSRPTLLTRQEVLALAGELPLVSALEPEWTPEDHANAFRGVREALSRGNSYQVNITFPLTGRLITGSDFTWQAALRLWLEILAPSGNTTLGQGREGVFAHLGAELIVSLSPELFFQKNGEQVTSRPMKGTSRRGQTSKEDLELREALVQSPKDRAENLMITDMIRNDLGRVAGASRVEVPRLFEAEAYPTVWQLTSTVTATLAPETQLAPLMAALFPCASITGAPKLRTQELLEQLEGTPRGWYTGTLGWAYGDKAHFNVLIRTLVFPDAERPEFRLGVGGGIVWDSIAQDEYQEALAKSLFLARAQRNFDLFETLLWEPEGGWLLLDLHWARVAESARVFGTTALRSEFTEALEAAVSAALAATEVGNVPLKVKVALLPNGRWQAEAQPAGVWPDELTWALSAGPLTEDLLLFRQHKTSDRGVYQSGLVEGVDQTVFWNPRGELTETQSMNLAVKLGGEWLTPPLSSGLLPGTYRAHLLEKGLLREQVLFVADLEKGQELAFFNSVRRWKKGKPLRPTLR